MRLFESLLAHRIGWALVHSVWQDVLIAGLLAIGLFAFRRSSSSIRYGLASAALSAAAVSPFLTFWVLRVRETESQWVSAAGATMVGAVNTAPAGFLENLAGRTEAVLPQAVALWLVGLAAMAMRLLGGLWLVERTRRTATYPCDAEWQKRLASLAVRLGVRRPVQLLLTEREDVPSAIGVLRLAVLLPVSALSRLSPDQIEALLAHELAHIRRFDYLVNLLQSVVETTQFYHPAVWWISSVMRTERENCCDDLAVQALGDRVAYARALASLETLRVLTPQLAMSANGGSLMQRIKRILGSQSRATRGGYAWLPCLALAAVVAPLGAFYQAQKAAKKPADNKPLVMSVTVAAQADKTASDEDTAVAAGAKPKLIELRASQTSRDAGGLKSLRKIVLESSDGKSLSITTDNSVWDWDDSEFQSQPEPQKGSRKVRISARAQRSGDGTLSVTTSGDGDEDDQPVRIIRDLDEESSDPEVLAIRRSLQGGDHPLTAREAAELRQQVAQLQHQLGELRSQLGLNGELQALGELRTMRVQSSAGGRHQIRAVRLRDGRMKIVVDGKAQILDPKAQSGKVKIQSRDLSELGMELSRQHFVLPTHPSVPPMALSPNSFQELKSLGQLHGEVVRMKKLSNGMYEIEIRSNGKVRKYKVKAQSKNFKLSDAPEAPAHQSVTVTAPGEDVPAEPPMVEAPEGPSDSGPKAITDAAAKPDEGLALTRVLSLPNLGQLL